MAAVPSFATISAVVWSNLPISKQWRHPMRVTTRFLLAVCMVLGLVVSSASVGSAQKQTTKEADFRTKILGTWELVKSDDASPSDLKIRLTFEEDGKMIVNATLNGRTLRQTGTYEIKDGQLVTAQKLDERDKKLANLRDVKEVKQTTKIETLDDTRLVTSKERKKTEFKKVK
jgi:uncharacterized protein (TIGR03066 family)